MVNLTNSHFVSNVENRAETSVVVIHESEFFVLKKIVEI